MHALHNRFEMEQSDWSFQHSSSANTVSPDPLFGLGATRLDRDTLNRTVT